MLIGEWQTVTIAQNASSSGEVDLGRAYETLLLLIPAMDDTTINIDVAMKSGGDFFDHHITDTVAADNNKVLSATATAAFEWTIPLGGYQYIKVIATNSQDSAERTLYACGVRS